MSMMIFKDIVTSYKTIADKIPDFSKNITGGDLNGLTTRNGRLEGQTHPETGIPYERKTVETHKGENVDGVFPVFDSKFDANLPEILFKSSDSQQFKESNRQLKEWVDNNPDEARNIFDTEQLEDIARGRTPEGCTWHHSEEKGVMQLVDTEVHAKTGHTGGKTIWGGGNENR